MKITKGFWLNCMANNLLYLSLKLDVQARQKESTDVNFVKSTPTPLPKKQDLKELFDKFELDLKQLVTDFPQYQQLSEQLQTMIPKLKQSSSNAEELLKAYRRILSCFQQYELNIFSSTDSSCFIVTAKDDYVLIHPINQKLLSKNNSDSKKTKFISQICRLNEILRSENRQPTQDELIAIQVATQLVQDGKHIDFHYRHWETSGFRDIQTYMSITDPGEGHIYGTASKLDYLKGVIVHIEHLERGNQDRQQIESYRIPNIKTTARVRLCIGSDASISSYIGRPIFENGFEPGLLKTVNTVASACSEMFGLGLAECKIAIEGMTATEAIKFMQCISGAVRRDRHIQCLSAAFNINTAVFDDRCLSHRWVKERFEIGLLGIELAKAGGFDKVTWDGSSNSYPSTCILEQLSHEQSLQLVHFAHEVGLLTYFSAGFRYDHLPLAVYTGVDGVGVGGAQILRYMDKTTGYHGPFKPENITEILHIRDEAANEWLGQSATLLSRLDRMFYEGSISVDDNKSRLELFEAVKTKHQKACYQLLDSLEHIRQIGCDLEHPLIEWGKRLIVTGEKSLLAQTKNAQEWKIFVQLIEKAIKIHDIELLADELKSTQPTVPPANSAVVAQFNSPRSEAA
jgi:hypothetical protein